MRSYHIILAIASLMLGCSSASGGGIAPSCPAEGCDNDPCTGKADGAGCVGFTSAELRGWRGFCVADVCTEFVPVRCQLPQPPMVVTGCDGSGVVSGGDRIDFKYNGGAATCAGVEGEFGYCAPGTPCEVYVSSVLVGAGVCQ